MLRLRKRTVLANRADLIRLARSLQDPQSTPVRHWQRAAAIVRHQRPDLADQVRQICKHKAVV